MEHPRLVVPSAFCWNVACPDYGKVHQGNMRRFGRTGKGTQRYQCRTCQRTCVATIGTVFYGRHHDHATILDCLALLAERTSLAAIRRTKGIKEETCWPGCARRQTMSSTSRRCSWPTIG